MTYNFDPDKWYENHKAALDEKLDRGELDEETYRKALQDLDRRYEEMVKHLDGTYRLP